MNVGAPFAGADRPRGSQTTCAGRRRGESMLLLAAVVALPLALPAQATLHGMYDVNHQVTLTYQVPPPPGVLVREIRHRWTINAAATGAMPGNFKGNDNIGAAGCPALNDGCLHQIFVTGTLAQSHALADASVTAVGPPLTGRIRAEGDIDIAPGGGASAASSSALTVRAGRNLANGHIKWGHRATARVTGSVSGLYSDPIMASVFDVGGTDPLFSALLYDLNGSIGQGMFDWTASGFMVDALDFSLHIQMPGTVTTQMGAVDFIMAGGLVTASSASGYFGSLALPSVGSTPGSFTVPFSDVEMDYDLGNFGGADAGQPVDVELDFGNSGAVMGSTAPEPSTAVLLTPILVAGVAWRTRSRARRS